MFWSKILYYVKMLILSAHQTITYIVCSYVFFNGSCLYAQLYKVYSDIIIKRKAFFL